MSKRRPTHVKIDDVITWVRGRGPGDAEDLVAMYFKGMCNRGDEGQVGFDVRVRPVRLGLGPYTSTVGGDDVRWSAP